MGIAALNPSYVLARPVGGAYFSYVASCAGRPPPISSSHHMGVNGMTALDEVFGVTSRPIHSYVERAQVDDSFREALGANKQIIVYGSSKQGKTALVSKHLPYDDNILVSLTPKFQLIDVYQSILTQAGVKIIASTTEKSGTEQKLSVGLKLKAMIPVFGGGEAKTEGTTAASSGKDVTYEEVPANLELPQSISELLKKVGCDK